MAELQRQLDTSEQILHVASQRQRQLAREFLEQERKRAAIALRIAAGIIIAGTIAGVILVLLVVRSIIRPLQATTVAIRRVNAGETAIDLPPVGPDEFGAMALALRQFRDHAEKLRMLAYQDPLTGLGNRAALEDSIQREIERSARDGSAARFALVYLDLDNFRAVNEKLGNKGGDRYLCEAATRIQRFCPINTQTYRYSGDKFIVLVDDLADVEDAQAELSAIADALLHGCSEPYPVGNHLLSMSLSIGIALYPEDGHTVEQLIGSAEAAVYAAKKGGRRNARFAAAQATGTARRQLALTTDIRRSLERREFDVYYQPIVDVARQCVVGGEALLRWRHPERGLLLPGEFIQVAEDAGLIAEISEHCLTVAHRQVCAWARRGLRFRVSVNLSARQAQDARILRLLDELIEEDPRAAQLMDFELTESVLFDSSEQTRSLLDAIRKRGYRLGLDDFGTGYASFSYVQRLPIDKIKIDRQFVAQATSSRQARAIISATLDLARNLELEVIAEGVETAEQMRVLQQEGCPLQQGFLYSRAIPAAEFERWAASFQLERIAS
ncbi:MAG: EAL domain-containing protein [Pseudomonadota bacterium]